MKVLLDTNVLIHREASTVVRTDIGRLFAWLDKLQLEKCVHPASLEEINGHGDPRVVATFKAKLQSYVCLKTLSPDTSEIAQLRAFDRSKNDRNDTSLLAEVASGRVDLLVTEDRGIHSKADALLLGPKVFTIDGFLEKVTAENPGLADYKVLSVRKRLFGEMNLQDPFFDSFREDYAEFDAWFRGKADEPAYVCLSDDGRLLAFLYLKAEGPSEDYTDIVPSMARASRLKIGTFKVISNGYKLGERFLKIVFDNALRLNVDEIYVTAFRRSPDQERLVRLLEDWGFGQFGKKGKAQEEEVLVRPFRPTAPGADPRKTFPYASGQARKFIVPIWPDYHTELLPDSILNNESPADFEDDRPNRNAISKVYISRSYRRDLKPGDLIVFYRTAAKGASAYYTAVATTLGVVHEVVTKIPSRDAFVALCRKRSVFSDMELAKYWDYSPGNRPFVVNFLYAHSFPKRPNRKALLDAAIIGDEPFRGFEELSDKSFRKLLEVAGAEKRLIVD